MDDVTRGRGFQAVRVGEGRFTVEIARDPELGLNGCEFVNLVQGFRTEFPVRHADCCSR